MDRRAFTLSASDASWASGAFCEPFTLYGWIGLDFSLSTHGKACWIPSQLCQLSSDDSLCCTSSRYECEVVSFSELQGTGAQWDHTVWAGRRWRSLFGGSPRGSGQPLYLLSEDVLAPSPLLAHLLCQLHEDRPLWKNDFDFHDHRHVKMHQRPLRYIMSKVSITRLSAIYFRGSSIPQVKYYTLLSGFRLPWPRMSRNVHSRWQFPNSKLQFLKRSFKIATTETLMHSEISASKNSWIPELQLSHCKIATPETMPHSKLFACVFKIETPKTMPYSKISACVFQIEVPALQNCNSRNKDLCKNNTNKNVLLSNGMNGGANYFTFVLKQANTHLLLTAVMKEVESCKC